jgi:hypothetical protein
MQTGTLESRNEVKMRILIHKCVKQAATAILREQINENLGREKSFTSLCKTMEASICRNLMISVLGMNVRVYKKPEIAEVPIYLWGSTKGGR